MAKIKKSRLTKMEIVQVALRKFLEIGYTDTTVKAISQELNISTGNLTFYYPTKEHLLLELVQMLCDFQWRLLEEEADRGYGSAASICLELMTVASACAENRVARDFFVSTFQSELCRNYLLHNHVDRAKKIFAAECKGWDDSRFEQAEIMVMGLQYATVVSTDVQVSVSAKVEAALDQILSIYNVDAPTRKREIEKVMAIEKPSIGKLVLTGFMEYVDSTNQKAMEKLLES